MKTTEASTTRPLHPREAEIRADEAMDAEVAESGAGIPPLIKARTDESRQVLFEIARLVVGDVPATLAMTDAARYRRLTRLRTELILRGYHDYFKRLTEAA